MENHSYLTASRLYLISKAIYKNLNTDAEERNSQSVKVMVCSSGSRITFKNLFFFRVLL